MSVSIEQQLRDRLAVWERMYEERLAESTIKIWLETFRDLRCTEVLLERAFTIIQAKAVRFPKPGHLTAAIEAAREERNVAERPKEEDKTPHVSEMPESERLAMAKTFRETLGQLGLVAKIPPAEASDARMDAERIRQKQALAGYWARPADSRPMDASTSPSSAAPPTPAPAPIAVESPEPTPEDLAQPAPVEITDEDIPF